jgi:hypothetical protein
MKTRKIRLVVRDFGYRGGNWHVGYWDGNTGDPGKDFRSFGSRPTREEAEKMAEKIISKEPGRYK